MGCTSSKLDDNARPPRRTVRTQQQQQPIVVAPSGGPQMVPLPYRDQAGRLITHGEFELDRNTPIQALQHMGTYLDGHGVTANVVTVGGVVNTIYLRSRQSTHDVDFFMMDPASPQHQIIHEAARSAARSAARNGQVQLGANWFNNVTQLLMGRQVQQAVVRDALQQKTIVHQQVGQLGGLVVYAAPWSYALCEKLNRLCEQNPRPYDQQDAVVYLHEHLTTTSSQTVTRAEIKQWCREYRKNVTDAVLDGVNNLYRQMYGRDGIVRS